MTAKHTNALDHVLAEALRDADTIQIRVLDRGTDGVPTAYRAIAWLGSAQFFSSPQSTATGAIDRAMRLLRAEKGDGPLKVVDFATVELESGA
jgi:hypothetical protein